MIRIRFRGEDRAAFGEVLGEGVDGVGRFQLSGTLDQDTTMQLLKTYASHSWMWRCRITPFGIFGTWHHQGSQRVEGCVWLWKEEWMTQTLISETKL